MALATQEIYTPGEKVPGGQIAPQESRAPGALWDSGGMTYEWTGTHWIPLRPTTPAPAPTPTEKLPMTGEFLTGVAGPTGGGYPTFAFDLEAEQKVAYEKLKPFYENILAYARGDLDLAKRIIQYTYESGIREATTEAELEQRRMGIDFPSETSRLQTEQNRRGVLESGFGETARGRLLESQAIRREAVDRALKQREEQLAKTREFGLEKEERGIQRGFEETERAKQKEALEMAQTRYGISQQKYGAEVGKYTFEEQQKAQQKSLELQQKALG